MNKPGTITRPAVVAIGTCWSGTSGLVLPEPNKAAFPAVFRSQPRLAYYAFIFNSLEINSSFYKIPRPATFEKWAAIVPDDFRFTVKLGQQITHAKGFDFSLPDLVAFMSAADRIGSKKGCLLIQLPPSLRHNAANAGKLRVLLQEVQRSGAGWKIAVEFRHASWYIEETWRLLDEWDAVIVLQDMPASKIDTSFTQASFIYIRFHGPQGDYKGGYSDEYLHAYAHRIKIWLSEGKDVYVYFNNTIGDAVRNSRTLMEFV